MEELGADGFAGDKTVGTVRNLLSQAEMYIGGFQRIGEIPSGADQHADHFRDKRNADARENDEQAAW